MSQPSPQLLRSIGLFSDLDDKALESLGREFSGRRYEAGHEIATEGTGGLLFFVVESGEAKVSLRGNEVGRIGPGDAFGELALVDLSARSATVTAIAPMRCWVLASWSFRPFVRSHPEVAWKLLELMAERLRKAESV